MADKVKDDLNITHFHPKLTKAQEQLLDELVITMREYVDIRFNVNEREVLEAKRNASAALDKAQTALEKRLDIINEFRAAMGDQAKSFMTMAEYDQAHKRLIEYADLRFAVLENARTESQQRLREYIDLRFSVQDKEVCEAKRVAEKEVCEAKRVAAESINEAKILMQSRLDIADDAREEMKDDIKELQGIVNIAKGKASQNGLLIAYAIAALGLIMSAISLFR